jgi:hypothetical protein
MLSVLFSITLAYEIVSCLTGLIRAAVSTDPDMTAAHVIIGVLMTGVMITFAALAAHLGGTFAFVVGIIFAVLAGLAMICYLASCATKGIILHGIYGIYNFVMMILFIVALAL